MESVPQSIIAQRSMPKPMTARRGQTVFESHNVVLVRRLRLVVALGAAASSCALKRSLLVHRVVELGVGVAHLPAVHEELEALDVRSGSSGFLLVSGEISTG